MKARQGSACQINWSFGLTSSPASNPSRFVELVAPTKSSTLLESRLLPPVPVRWLPPSSLPQPVCGIDRLCAILVTTPAGQPRIVAWTPSQQGKNGRPPARAHRTCVGPRTKTVEFLTTRREPQGKGRLSTGKSGPLWTARAGPGRDAPHMHEYPVT